MLRLEYLPEFEGKLVNLGSRDVAIVRENVEAIRRDPRAGGHPSDLGTSAGMAACLPAQLRRDLPLARRGPIDPSDTIVLEGIVERF